MRIDIELLFTLAIVLFALSLIAIAASFIWRTLKNSRAHFKSVFDPSERELINHNFSSSLGINATEMDKDSDDSIEDGVDAAKKIISLTLCRSVTDRPHAMVLTETKNKIIIAGSEYKPSGGKDSYFFNTSEFAGEIAHIGIDLDEAEPVCKLFNHDENVDLPVYVDFFRVKKCCVLKSNSIIKVNKSVFKVLIE